jgi:hypothetical protein
MDLFGLPNKVWAIRKQQAAAELPVEAPVAPSVVYAGEPSCVSDEVLA